MKIVFKMKTIHLLHSEMGFMCIPTVNKLKLNKRFGKIQNTALNSYALQLNKHK